MSTDLCRVEEDVLCVGLEIHIVWELTRDSVDDNGIIIEWTLGVLKLENAEAEAQKNGITEKSMFPIKKQERVVVATWLKKIKRKIKTSSTA